MFFHLKLSDETLQYLKTLQFVTLISSPILTLLFSSGTFQIYTKVGWVYTAPLYILTFHLFPMTSHA